MSQFKVEQFAASLEERNISFKTVCGGSGFLDVQTANVWKSDLLQTIEDLQTTKKIFKVHESREYLKFTPAKYWLSKANVVVKHKAVSWGRI